MTEEKGAAVHKQRLGKAGEIYAAEVIRQAGLSIIKQNYRCPKGEIDIIALDRGKLIFIEVRTRSSALKGWGEESITSKKIRRIQASATYYIMECGYKDWPELRFDVIAIKNENNKFEFNWIKNIF